MKKKILAIGLCVCICFALLAIPAFATSAPETTSAPNVFGSLFGSSVPAGYSYTVNASWSLLPFGSSNACTVSYPFSIGSVSLSVGDSVYVEAPNNVYLIVNGVNTGAIANTGYSVVYFSESSYLARNNALQTGTPFSVGADGLVPELADEVFSVGGSLISFVMSHWIVLIPVVAFLVILCIGAIRKMIKGE